MPQEVEIDEYSLENIAKQTGGKYFRAISNHNLEQIYEEINQLEKSQVKSHKIYEYHEFFNMFSWLALGILLIDFSFRFIIFKNSN